LASHRRRKQKGRSQGLTAAELGLCELLDEVLQAYQWSQVLGWSNQYLLQQQLSVSDEERDRVMKAAVQAVEDAGRLANWRERLEQIRADLQAIDRSMREADEHGGGA
jgi:hypothetical protein